MEMFFLGVLVGLVIAWFLIKLIVEFSVTQVQKKLGSDFDRVLAHMEKELEEAEDAEPTQVRLSLERHNDSYMVFHGDTSQFLAQGPDYWAIIARLETLYPENTTFKIVSGEPDAVKDFITSSEKPRPA